MDCYGDVLHFINANYLNYAIMPEYARICQSMHVVQLIPGFLFKSFNGAPSAAKNGPYQAKISLPRIVLRPVPTRNV